MIHEELSGKIIGAAMDVLNRAYPCYPFNPWFFSDFEKIVADLAPK